MLTINMRMFVVCAAVAVVLAAGDSNFIFFNTTSGENKKCEKCTCDCDWTKKSGCGKDDHSCCWDCCCKEHPSPKPPSPEPPSPEPSPKPPSPVPPPGPAPGPSPSGLTLYCPSKNGFKKEYGNGDISDSGSWKIKGGGRVASKASYNLLGGYVEFEMDTKGAKTGVNNNFYLTSPDKEKFPKYCDIQEHPGCMEMDIVENNGHCESQITWHTHGSIGKGNCDRGGCHASKKIPSDGKMTVKAEFSEDGEMTVTINGDKIDKFSPKPDDDAKKYVKETMEKDGGQIHSSQWAGWVPGGSCGSSGKLDDSEFEVSNVKVYGKHVYGDTPETC